MVLLLVAAASLQTVFDAIKLQYQLILDFFKLEDAGMILVKGVKDKGDIQNNDRDFSSGATWLILAAVFLVLNVLQIYRNLSEE